MYFKNFHKKTPNSFNRGQKPKFSTLGESLLFHISTLQKNIHYKKAEKFSRII